MGSNKTLTERLDAMSIWAFGEGGVVELIEALQTAILPTAAECDKISAELGALYAAEYAGAKQTALEARNNLGEVVDELNGLKETIETAEAQARLDAFALNPKTAKPFTAKQIADRALVALAANEEYQKLNPGAPGLAVMEAQARLDAGGFDETTAKPYTVDQTKDRAAVALAKDEKYQKLVARQRVLEGQKAGALAILADCDTALSMYRNRNRALCARLNNLTAGLGR